MRRQGVGDPDLIARVLIADDHPLVRYMLRLAVNGYVEKSGSADEIADAIDVVVAGTGAVAPERARRAPASSDGFAKRNGRGAANGPKPTPREREVLRLIAEGMTSREMAALLEVSLSTVESHIANVYAKFGIRNRVEAVQQAVTLGIVHGR